MDRHPRDPVAVASTTHRPPLDPTDPLTPTTANLQRAPTVHHSHGHREPNLGLPAYLWRTGRPRGTASPPPPSPRSSKDNVTDPAPDAVSVFKTVRVHALKDRKLTPGVSAEGPGARDSYCGSTQTRMSLMHTRLVPRGQFRRLPRRVRIVVGLCDRAQPVIGLLGDCRGEFPTRKRCHPSCGQRRLSCFAYWE